MKRSPSTVTHARFRSLVTSLCVLTCLAGARNARAREVDQFTNRLFQLEHLADASAVIDAEMNATLARVVAELNIRKPAGRQDRDQIVRDAFQSSRIDYIAQVVTPFESWLSEDADIELWWVTDRGIYGGSVDYDDMKMGWYIEPSPVARIGPVLIGIDKIGHFLSQGWFYYQKERDIRTADPRASEREIDRRVRKYGHELEIGYLGLGGTGVYSYADLAANWQGLLFYRSLFTGPEPYIAVDSAGAYQLVRRFHIADYTTDAWDEVINPSRPLTDPFYGKVARYVRAQVCPEYRAAPAMFLNASGRSQDPQSYIWEGAIPGSFASNHRFSIQEICR